MSVATLGSVKVTLPMQSSPSYDLKVKGDPAVDPSLNLIHAEKANLYTLLPTQSKPRGHWPSVISSGLSVPGATRACIYVSCLHPDVAGIGHCEEREGDEDQLCRHVAQLRFASKNYRLTVVL